jgi:hypothetical protein
MVALTCIAAGWGNPAGKAAVGSAADPGGSPLVHETFTEATAPEFTGYNEACLTGGPAGAPSAGAHVLGGCEPAAAEAGPVPPLDAAPHGYLRLTDAGRNRSAAVLFNHALPASDGLDVTFDVWQYGNNPNDGPPADGVSFFLTDGEGNLTAPGAFGGSLGYAKKQQTPQQGGPYLNGVEDGYLGVGLDVLGNYFADTEQRGQGCENQRSPAGTPSMDADFFERGPNMVTLRGPGDGFDGYCYITATTDFAHSQPPSKPWPSNLPGDLQGPTTSLPAGVSPEEAERLLEVSRRRVNVRVTPAPDPRVIVTVDFGAGPHEVLDVPAPTPVPRTYKFGFAASTGSFNDVHLIRNVAVHTDRPLPRLDLVKQVAEPRPAHLSAGDHVRYEFVVTNSGHSPVTHLAVHDPVTGPVACPVAILAAGQTVTCTATYTVTPADVARGFIANTAMATGDAGGHEVASPPASEHLELIEPPGLSLEKRVRTPGPHHAGQTVHYSYLVTNTGGVTLDSIHVTDDHVTGVVCQATTLAPAGSPDDHTTCHGTYVITDADAASGLVTNTAVAAGTENSHTITSPPSQQTILIGAARLTVRKRAVTPGPHFAGGSVRYDYVVTNTGSLTLHDVAVTDDRVTRVTCDKTTLAPHESTTCHGTYRITATDASLRHVTNFAQAAGTDTHGHTFVSELTHATIPVRHAKPKPTPTPTTTAPTPTTTTPAPSPSPTPTPVPSFPMPRGGAPTGGGPARPVSPGLLAGGLGSGTAGVAIIIAGALRRRRRAMSGR